MISRKFVLALAGCLAALAAGLSLLVAPLWADLPPQEKEIIGAALAERAGLALFGIFVACAAVGLALQSAFRAYVHPALKYTENILVQLHTNPSLRLEPVGGSEFGPLAQAINALADQRDALQRDIVDKIAEAKRSVEEERNRLAALMSELAQSVVVCNLDGRIILYNNRARLQFRALAEGSGGGGLIGLGRSIFTLFERNLISHALESIQHRLTRGGSQPVAHFVTTARAGQLLRVQMAPVLSPPEDGAADAHITGYVLVLENITRTFETESKRDEMLQALTEGSRASLANIRAAVETLHDYPDMVAEQRERFVRVIGEEARALSQRLDHTVTETADLLKVRWPLEDMLGADLIAAARRRIEQHAHLPTKTEIVDASLWIRADSYSLLQAITYLAARLKEEYEVREIRFRLTAADRLVYLDMLWVGPLVSTETLMDWEMEPMRTEAEASPLTLRDVIDRHSGEIWHQRETAAQRSYFRVVIPAAAPQEEVEAAPVTGAESRPEYYDFDLFRQTGGNAELDERPLTELTYTVFDTETTGLDPAAGEEIIQIGAVRIVNGRLLRQEYFDQLVDPRRRLARASARVHGITEDMLRGQPTIEIVLPAFHDFCEDTVLVGHNAAFDLRFFQLKEEAAGVRFTQPVLDTLLLSPIIHPNQERHRLEAICERLGVNVIGRHTALGDAIVTGEAFLRMIPLLAEQGIRTLGQAREASQQSYYARVSY